MPINWILEHKSFNSFSLLKSNMSMHLAIAYLLICHIRNLLSTTKTKKCFLFSNTQFSNKSYTYKDQSSTHHPRNVVPRSGITGKTIPNFTYKKEGLDNPWHHN